MRPIIAWRRMGVLCYYKNPVGPEHEKGVLARFGDRVPVAFDGNAIRVAEHGKRGVSAQPRRQIRVDKSGRIKCG